jgi:hypothetical protein
LKNIYSIDNNYIDDTIAESTKDYIKIKAEIQKTQEDINSANKNFNEFISTVNDKNLHFNEQLNKVEGDLEKVHIRRMDLSHQIISEIENVDKLFNFHKARFNTSVQKDLQLLRQEFDENIKPLQDETKGNLDREMLIKRFDRLSTLKMQFKLKEYKIYEQYFSGDLNELENKFKLVQGLNDEYNEKVEEEVKLSEKKFNLLNIVRSFPLLEAYSNEKAKDSQYDTDIFKQQVFIT